MSFIASANSDAVGAFVLAGFPRNKVRVSLRSDQRKHLELKKVDISATPTFSGLGVDLTLIAHVPVGLPAYCYGASIVEVIWDDKPLYWARIGFGLGPGESVTIGQHLKLTPDEAAQASFEDLMASFFQLEAEELGAFNSNPPENNFADE